MSVIGGQNPIVQDGLVYILDFGNERSYTSGSNSAQSLIYNPVTASFVAPPAGDYSGLAAAYSVRRVVSGYSGPAMEVQSGSVSQSIGFDSSGNLDTASLEAFAGSGDAFVKTWYDQSGNGNNATATSTSQQPKVVSAGSTILQGGKPAMLFDGSNDRMDMANLHGQSVLDTYFVASTSDTQYLYPNVGTAGNYGFVSTLNSTSTGLTAGYGTPSLYANGTLFTGTTRDDVYDFLSGSKVIVHQGASTSGWSIYSFSGYGGFQINGYLQELIAYNSDKSTIRPSIESDINSYYNIYTSSFSPTPEFNTDKLELIETNRLSLNQSFPGFSYDQGNLTLIFTGETKTASTLFTQANQISVLGTTSSIGYGLPGNSGGRTFPASGFDHISLRFTTGSVDCFVNGIPTAPNSIFPTGSFGTGDFIASNYSGSLGNLLVYNRELTDDEIYATYLQQARRYSLPETPKPYTVDSSVYAYTQAAGITGSAVITALDAFVSGLKANGLWNKMIAIYPFLGADTTKTRYNLKDPSLNTTAITYSGSWSGSDSGSRNNNTSSYGILENIKGDYYHPLISSESIHLSYLSYDTPVSGGYLMGVEEIPGLPGDIAAPAAAYSVRKVRTAYTGSAMTVRRDFDDLTFDVGFDASGNLDTGSLLTNMTASGVTAALPGDYSGLAAAYSLRKVSSSYSGYAVEVRRAVDNYSASIGFDGSGNLNTASLASFIRTGSETPIDTYSGLAVAYSLRKVVPGYAGFAIQVQSASATQDIGFDSFGDLDVAAIKSFAGSGDAFVRTWYDQSGNSYDATNTSLGAQPKIYSGSLGTVVTQGGKPAISFVNNTMFISGIPSSSNYNDFWVMQPTDDIFIPLIAMNGNRFSWIALQGSNGNYLYEQFGTPTLYKNSTLSTPTTQGSIYTAFQGYNLIHTAGANTTTWNSGWQIAGYGSPYGLIANLQEILIYTASVSANRTYIENNINSYYGIYTPDSVSTEDAYVKTWYDQSGNNRHATQSVDANQPQIVSNGVIVTENGKPTIDHTSTTTLELASDLNLGKVHSMFGVVKFDAYGKELFGKGIGSFTYGIYQDATNNYYSAQSSFVSSNGVFGLNFSLLTIQRDNTTVTQYKNSSILGGVMTLTGANNDFLLRSLSGEQNTAYNLDGKLSEALIYSGSVTASRNLIEDNINGYYNIFTHTLESGSGYVSKWYDQSGNDNHAVQSVAANQPLILSSGSVILENGKPTLQFDGTNDYLSTTSFSVSTNDITLINVFKFNALNDYQTFISFGGYVTNGFLFQKPNQDAYRYATNGDFQDYGSALTTNQSLIELYDTSDGNTAVYRDSTLLNTRSQTTSINGSNVLEIGRRTDTTSQYTNMLAQEFIFYPSDQSSNREPIQQDINSYFSIYTPEAYNLNTNSLSLFSSPTTVVGAANNVASASFTTGGPLGLITVTRTGSSDYTLWKNRVPNKVTIGASAPLSNELYLNAANLNNSLFSGSQNNISFASVGAGLTDDEVYTYYELVDDLQTSLNRGVQDPNAFITTWDTRITGTGTVTNTSSIALPLYGTQAITASWGDGTESYISQSSQVDRTHSYAEPGIYTVSITGQGQGFQFNNGGDRAKLIDIAQWGSISGSTTDTFEGCINLVGTSPDPHVLQTTSLSEYFRGSTRFNGYIGNWNTSNITNTFATFFGANAFNQDLGNWNVNNISTFNNIFNNAPAFNNGGSDSIKNWNIKTSGPVTMNAMFAGANFNQPIGSWNTSAVTNMASMFQQSPFNQNIGAWDVSKVTTMTYMFYWFGAGSKFNNGGSPDINNWRPISCSNFSQMFATNTLFNQPIGGWQLGTGSHIPATGIDMSSMFVGATSFNQNIGAWNVEKVTNLSGLLGGVTAFNNLGSSDINNWRPISCSNFSSMFSGATAFNQPIGNWTIGTGSQIPSTGINMSSMFNNADAFNQNIGSWNVEKVTNMASMFLNNGGFNNSGSSDINNWRPISCSNFSNMFNNATAFNQPIGNWTIGTGSNMNVTMSNMFTSATSFNQNIGSWDVEKVTNMSSMFRSATSFNNSGSNSINNWRPVSCSNFGRMFESATGFNQPIGGWQLGTGSDITISLNEMFAYNGTFNQPIGTWDTRRVTNMYLMLAGASSFNQDIGSWDVSNVTSMNIMFTNASNFNNGGSPSINNWNTSKVTGMNRMFENATSFNQPIGNWNVGNVTSFGTTFMNTSNYSFLHEIYDGWINHRLQPNRTIGFGTNNYSASAAEGKALLERPYVTQSIVNIQDSASFINIVTQGAHNLTPNNKVFIYNVSGSISGSVNGLRTVLSTGSATEFTLSGSVFNPADIYDMGTGLVITGYGWNITDGNPV